MSEQATNERGDAHIVIYLTDVTSDDIDRICEAVCDALVAHGLGSDEDDAAAPVRALVGIKAEPFPDLESDAAIEGFLARHAAFLVPTDNNAAPDAPASEAA